MKNKFLFLFFIVAITNAFSFNEANITQVIKTTNEILAQRVQVLSHLVGEINSSQMSYLHDIKKIDENITNLHKQWLTIEEKQRQIISKLRGVSINAQNFDKAKTIIHPTKTTN